MNAIIPSVRRKGCLACRLPVLVITKSLACVSRFSYCTVFFCFRMESDKTGVAGRQPNGSQVEVLNAGGRISTYNEHPLLPLASLNYGFATSLQIQLFNEGLLGILNFEMLLLISFECSNQQFQSENMCMKGSFRVGLTLWISKMSGVL